MIIAFFNEILFMKNLWAYLLVLFLILSSLLVAEFRGCTVSGHEFSPDDFTARSFSYRRSPLTQTLRSQRVNKPYEFDCTAIVGDGHIQIVTVTPQRWDLFAENTQLSDRLSSEFDARFLTHFFTGNTDQWTVAYPEKAALLWPEIAKLARSGLYLHIPEILTHAIPDQYVDQADQSLEAFKSEIGQRLADAYRMAARLSAINGDPRQSEYQTAADQFARW